VSSFPLSVKATLDSTIKALAEANGWLYFDQASAYLENDTVVSEQPALSADLLHLSEDPRDPFYRVQFEVGVKTSNDAAQYESVLMASAVQSRFAVGVALPVADFDFPATLVGELVIADVGSIPAAYDRTAGFRPIHVNAKAYRFG